MKAFAETFNECVFLENLYIYIYIYIYIYVYIYSIERKKMAATTLSRNRHQFGLYALFVFSMLTSFGQWPSSEQLNVFRLRMCFH